MNLLEKYGNEISKLITIGFDPNQSINTAKKLFGKDKVKFIAVDGTESNDQELDMSIFYAGAFAYVGELVFTKNGCTYTEPEASDANMEISSAIPIHEEDLSSVSGKLSEGRTEADPNEIPKLLMQLAEYYMAVKNVISNPEIKVVLLDRQLSIDIPHLLQSINTFSSNKSNILCGMDTTDGTISESDLELAKILHPNYSLKIPSFRGQFMVHAIVLRMIQEKLELSQILESLGIELLTQLKVELEEFDKEFRIFDKTGEKVSLKKYAEKYWQRVLSGAITVANYIFDTPESKHPLIFIRNGVNHWISGIDLQYLSLIMIYALLREAWEKKILLIGVVKDTTASELVKIVIPLLNSTGIKNVSTDIPNFNSDKMLLQTSSLVNSSYMKTPWRTIEFDTCFKTIRLKNNSPTAKVEVEGSYKNLISQERMFIKSYFQLWSSNNDESVRSHVFSYDRPSYHDFDSYGNFKLCHKLNDSTDIIEHMLCLGQDDISNLIMDVLHCMSLEVIPECLGYNYPLFLADKKAKATLNRIKSGYLSAVALERTRNDLDQQILLEEKFREFRSNIEAKRRH
jgi:hypothetical protein